MAEAATEELFSSALSSVLNCQKHITSLPSPQKTALEAFLSKKDVFAMLPTGLPYELSPLVAKKMYMFQNPVVVVMCSLVEVMQRRMEEATSMGVRVVRLEEQKYKDILKGKAQLLFGTPVEWMLNDKWRRLLSRLEDLVGIVLEEAHLNYKWGEVKKGNNDFRESFKRLGELRSIVKAGTPILALTAFADLESRARMKRQLNLENATTVALPLNWTNIRLGLQHISDPDPSLDCLDWIVQEVKEKGLSMSPVVIYCQKFRDVGRIFCYLKAELEEEAWVDKDPQHKTENLLIGMFHCNTLPVNKKRVLASLQGEGNCRVVVATNALGHNLNFPSISHVIVYGIPNDTEAIVQMISMAGRDSTPSHAIIYDIEHYTKTDAATKEMLIAKCTCFRKALFGHFEEGTTSIEPGHLCCTFCHSICQCQLDGCKVPKPIYEVAKIESAANGRIREVTEDDRLLVRDLLKEYQNSLVSGATTLFTSIAACTGFSEELIDAVVEHCPYIFDLDYITQKLPVFSRRHARGILRILFEVFEDFEDCPSPSPPPSFPKVDMNFTGYFD